MIASGIWYKIFDEDFFYTIFIESFHNTAILFYHYSRIPNTFTPVSSKKDYHQAYIK